MIKKQISKNGKTCKTTFSLPKDAALQAKEVILLGEFNNWDFERPIIMKKLKDASFEVEINLETGRAYQFRYLIDRTSWENDWDADDYVYIPEFGIFNSVIQLNENTERFQNKATKKTSARKEKTINSKKGNLGDDLKKIEGIGPKIAELLHAQGIVRYIDLAQAKEETLKEILSTAGSRYKMHDPGTWSSQAQLAAEEKWEELKVMQKSLKGGKE